MNSEYKMFDERLAQIASLLGEDRNKLPKDGIRSITQECFRSPEYVEPKVTEPPTPPLYDRLIITFEGRDGQRISVLTRVDPAARRETEAIILDNPNPLKSYLGTFTFMQHFNNGFPVYNPCINNPS